MAQARQRPARHHRHRARLPGADPAGPAGPARPHAAVVGRQPAAVDRRDGRSRRAHQQVPDHAARRQRELRRSAGRRAVADRRARRAAVGRRRHRHALRSVCGADAVGAVPAGAGVRDRPRLDDGAVDAGADRRAAVHQQLHRRAVALRRQHRAVGDLADGRGDLLDGAVGAGGTRDVDAADGVPARHRPLSAAPAVPRRAARQPACARHAHAHLPAPAGGRRRGSDRACARADRRRPGDGVLRPGRPRGAADGEPGPRDRVDRAAPPPHRHRHGRAARRRGRTAPRRR